MLKVLLHIFFGRLAGEPHNLKYLYVRKHKHWYCDCGYNKLQTISVRHSQK